MTRAWLEWLTGEPAADLVSPRFEFAFPLGNLAGWLLIAAGGALAFAYFWPKLRRQPFSARFWMTGARAVVAMLALFLALNPGVVGTVATPGDQYIAVLYDDSASMQVAAREGQSRGEYLVSELEANREAFLERLAARYQVTQYRFGGDIERVSDPTKLSFNRNESDPAGAVRAALEDLRAQTVSAAILFSDGAEQTGRPPADLGEILPDAPPVFTVGVDGGLPWADLAMRNLSVTRTHFDQSPLVVQADIESEGLAGGEAVFELVDGGNVLQSKTVQLTAAPVKVRLEHTPSRKGWLEYTARVRLADAPPPSNPDGEIPLERAGRDRAPHNNARPVLADNREREYRILYYSARPNWENKFFRRAMEDDPELRVTSLVRISAAQREFVFRGANTTTINPLFEGFEDDEEKYGRYDEPIYLRLGASESELIKGYPSEAEELFKFDLIVWGDVVRENFTLDQLERTRGFVDKRGGALLIMGGKDIFSDEHFRGSVIEPLLPALFDGREGTISNEDPGQLFQALPSIEGELSGTWSLGPGETASPEAWLGLPPLFGVNPVAAARAGSSVMAYASGDDPRAPLFMTQRYGAGVCAVMATGETWQWNMQTPLGDGRHQRLWRQIVRHLMRDVRGPIAARNPPDEWTAGEETRIEYLVRDPAFDPLEGARVAMRIETPSGRAVELPVEESIEESGLYAAAFEPSETGAHTVTVDVLDENGEAVQTREDAVPAVADMREFQNAKYNPDFLRAIAARAGGEFVPLSELASLAGRIPWREEEDAEVRRVPLWHHPAVFILIALLMSIEWYARRKKGYA